MHTCVVQEQSLQEAVTLLLAFTQANFTGCSLLCRLPLSAL